MSQNWYVMRTVPGKEEEAVSLLNRKIPEKFWKVCRVLRKQQLFRVKGEYLLSRKIWFPGYVFIQTAHPEELQKELEKAREFPQLIGDDGGSIVKVEDSDLRFLQNVCGEDLEHDMCLSTVEVDAAGQVTRAAGALGAYVGKIRRQRLRHRYVTAEVELFQRREDVLFGIRMEGDPK